MLKKAITYTDYNGVQRTEDFYFHLSKAELAEMELSEKGGMEQKLRTIIASDNNAEIVAIFKDLLLKAYGVKSEDGRRFIKSHQLSEEFSQTEAYVELYIELLSDPKGAADFVNGIIPQCLIEKVTSDPVETPTPIPAQLPEPIAFPSPAKPAFDDLPDSMKELIRQYAAEEAAKTASAD